MPFGTLHPRRVAVTKSFPFHRRGPVDLEVRGLPPEALQPPSHLRIRAPSAVAVVDLDAALARLLAPKVDPVHKA